jgi:hypothetical protein
MNSKEEVTRQTNEPTRSARARTPANTALTIPSNRLAGSPACLNCGTDLLGPFCYYCGQPDKNLMRFFPALVRDLLEDVVDFDSRFMRTLKPLLLHPGRLTRDYLLGRRFRYVPPMRLYIFSSMAFFILAATLTGQAIHVSEQEPGNGITIGFDGQKDAISRGLQQAVSEGELSEGDADTIARTMEKVMTPEDGSKPPGAETEADDTIMINGKPWDRETNPFNVPFMPDFINEWVNREIEESPQKGREIEANPNLFVDKVFDVLPVAVFVMLPLVALLFKFWYAFAGRYYVEHLIHALHNHAFLFVVFTLTLLCDSVASWLDPERAGWVSEAFSWVKMALLCWIPLYLLVSLKTVYRQGWPMTLIKFSVIGISYVVLMAMATSVAAVVGFVLL